MKKIDNFPKYWKAQNRHSRRSRRHRRIAKGLEPAAQTANDSRFTRRKAKSFRKDGVESQQIDAPPRMRLFQDLQPTLEFIRDLRALGQSIQGKSNSRIFVNLDPVREIDYATISILRAVIYDFGTREISIAGNLPNEPTCDTYLRESGYLDGLQDANGRPFPTSPQSAHIFFEHGRGRLTQTENLKISDLLSDAMDFLGGDIRHELKLKTLLLEGCANSIEWGETEGRQWMLGMKKEEKDNEREVIFTVTDVGKGILSSLRRKFSDQFLGFINFQTEHDVLQQAFERKWGSRTGEINRNNGLPTIKGASDMGHIKDLRVISNNVILRFGDNIASTFEKGFPRYTGTIYQWRVTRENLSTMELLKKV